MKLIYVLTLLFSFSLLSSCAHRKSCCDKKEKVQKKRGAATTTKQQRPEPSKFNIKSFNADASVHNDSSLHMVHKAKNIQKKKIEKLPQRPTLRSQNSDDDDDPDPEDWSDNSPPDSHMLQMSGVGTATERSSTVNQSRFSRGTQEQVVKVVSPKNTRRNYQMRAKLGRK